MDIDIAAVNAKVSEINTEIQRLYHATMGHEVLLLALSSDFARSNRLPTKEECLKMMSGSDDDEDVVPDAELQRLFPETYEWLESAWQLRPPNCTR